MAKKEEAALRSKADDGPGFNADRWREFGAQKKEQESPRAKRRRLAAAEAAEVKMAEDLTQNVIKAHVGVGAMNDAIMNSTIFNRIMDERDKCEAERRLIEMGMNPFKKGQEVKSMSAYLNDGFQTQRYRTKFNPPKPPKNGLKFYNSLRTAKERNAALCRAELDFSFYPTLRKAQEIETERKEKEAAERVKKKIETAQQRKEVPETAAPTSFDALVAQTDDKSEKENQPAPTADLFAKVFGDEESSDDE